MLNDSRRRCLLLLLTLLVGRGYCDRCLDHFNNCNNLHSKSEDNSLDLATKCQTLVEAMTCLNELTPAECPRGPTHTYLNGILHISYINSNCSQFEPDGPKPPQSNTTPPTVMECTPELPRLPENADSIEVKELSSPETKPKDSLSNTLCSQPNHLVLRHCSLFSYSHLRPFGSSDQDIQTCSLPGSWYLLKHPDVTIEVTGVSDGSKSSFTKLEKVNITLHSYKCTADATINYVASLSDTLLPSTFTSDEILKVKLLDPLDFHIDEDRSVVSIVAPWLNLTVVVTKHEGYLGVVLRMPRDLVKDADGLCSNKCPSHSVLSIDFKNDTCYHDKNSALFSCSENAGLRESGASSFFVGICQFDVFHSLSYNSILSFLKAIFLQYSLLPNYGPDVNQVPGSPGVVVPPLPAVPPYPAFSSSYPTSMEPSLTSTIKPPPLTSHFTTSTGSSSMSLSTSNPSSTPIASFSSASLIPQPTNDNERPLELPSSSGTVHINRILLLIVMFSSLFLLYRFQILC